MAAVSRSASGSTITGVELPSSSATCLRGWRWRMPQPTGGLPVKEIIGTSGWSTRALPTEPPPPITTERNPSGRPASESVRASSSADRGVDEAGFSTTGQPAAIAGASLWHTRFRGKLNGEMAPTTPTGSRRMIPSLPAPAPLDSIGTTSPARLRASTAAKVRVSTHRAASPRACFIGLPASRQMVRAKVSARSATSRAARSSTWARSAAGGGGRWPSASATAAATSSGPPTATRAMSSPVYGLTTARSSLRWSKRPPASSPVGWAGSRAGLRTAIAASSGSRAPRPRGTAPRIPLAGYARPVALPVVVAGAGPVGLTLACELDRLGVPCRLADAAAGRAVVSRAPATPRPGPGFRVRDAGPLARADGSRTSLGELLREPGLQLWCCAGPGPPDAALALAARFAPVVTSRVLLAGPPPPAARRGGGAGRREPARPRPPGRGRRGGVRGPAGRVPRVPLRAPRRGRIAGHLARLGVRAG